MIVVDSSALMAIVLDEQMAEDCQDALAQDDDVLISAGTLQEVLIVASRRGVGLQMAAFLDQFVLTVIDVNREAAEHAAEAYRRWGKGFHPAALNFGDCFAYAVAKAQDCPLLFVGNDFAQTDVKAAI